MAAAEILEDLVEQIAWGDSTSLGVPEVVMRVADGQVGSSGSSTVSVSQFWLVFGAGMSRVLLDVIGPREGRRRAPSCATTRPDRKYTGKGVPRRIGC